MITLNSDKPKRLGNHVSLLTGHLNDNTKSAIGIDPGSGFGITVIQGQEVSIYYGKLPQDKRKGYRGISAYNLITEFHKSGKINLEPNCQVIIEGAAYNSRFGQVGLEEVRIGFFISLFLLGFDVRIEPPATIRKLATGSGKDTIGNYFPSLNHGACDSLGCALAALKIRVNSDIIET